MSITTFFLLLVLGSATFASHSVPHAHPHLVVSSDPLSFQEELTTRSNSRTRSGSLKPLTPQELRAIYNFPDDPTAGAGKTIAIVDAFGASTVEEDLAVFCNEFGLPACTSENGCFQKVDQYGGTSYPVDDSGWGSEAALDVQTAHAFAPGASILLVVANSASSTDLFTAVDYARQHADYVSMSFGIKEGSYVSSYDATYFSNSPNVAFFASTGDSGKGVQFPASSPHVVAVGGTSVYTDSGYSLSAEKGWADSGGGCSKYFSSPALQQATLGYSTLGCNGKRAVPDVSMDANPDSGVYVYYSYGCTDAPNCWYQIGGTSLAAPLFAARAAVSQAVVNFTYVYSNHIEYRDITNGNNGYHCQTGLDLVTGQGSWIADL